MVKNSLLRNLVALRNDLDEIEQLTIATVKWATVRFAPDLPRFTSRHKEIVIRIAFLQCFVAWEAFLDESFTLYLLGTKPPRGRCPHRLYTPSKRKDAVRLVVGDRNYADWTKIGDIKDRAKKYFRNGDPYVSAFASHQNVFNEMNTIRNAIAHSSGYSKERFKALVRRRLGTYPPNLSIAKYLSMTIPSSTPPQSFLRYYLDTILITADSIVPN